MARRIPDDRFDELVRRATEEFIARGYRLTQMADIAEAVGVAKGTLYGYVESKDALLLLCLQHADAAGRIAVPEALPLRAPQSGQIGSLVKARLAEQVALPILAAALERNPAPGGRLDSASGSASGVAAEFAGIVGELYDLMASNRHGIKLLDRCMDHPELGQLWQTAGREQSRQALLRYFESRIRSGQIRAFDDPRLVTRIVVETCATWAVHIHWDRAPEVYDPDIARAHVIDFLVHGCLA